MSAPRKQAYNRRLGDVLRDDGPQGQAPGIIERLLPVWLTQLPAMVPKKDSKVYFVRLAVPILGSLVHLLLMFVFLLFNSPMMALVNAVSVAIFASAIGLVRSGRHRLGTAVSILEASIHAPIATVLLGLGAGYLTFNFIVAMCAALVYTRKERVQRLCVLIYAFVSSVVVSAFMHGREPIIHLEYVQVTAIFCMICASTYLALVGFAYHFVKVSEHAEARVERELARSDQLLLNILPAEVAARLKARPGTIADSFPSVTVLFADIVGFTTLASISSGPEIVALLNEVFSAFDRIAARYGLEKIKTIGDAYMVVGGIPKALPGHAEKVVRMALEMIEAVRTCGAGAKTPLAIRIGIHSGPVVAGVIGERKFAYDLWGDTVNTASRMESHGLPGQIQLTEQTAALLPPGITLADRGLIEVKGKGPIRTYFVTGAAAAEPAAAAVVLAA